MAGPQGWYEKQFAILLLVTGVIGVVIFALPSEVQALWRVALSALVGLLGLGLWRRAARKYGRWWYD